MWRGEKNPKLALCSPPGFQRDLCEPVGGLLGCQASGWVPSPGHCHWGNFTGAGCMGYLTLSLLNFRCSHGHSILHLRKLLICAFCRPSRVSRALRAPFLCLHVPCVCTHLGTRRSSMKKSTCCCRTFESPWLVSNLFTCVVLSSPTPKACS